MKFAYLDTPIGALLLAGPGSALAMLDFPEGKRPQHATTGWTRDDLAFADARRQLQEYFAGRRQLFDLELAPQGTPFQLQVWNALRAIPFGSTCSYGAIARAIGQPSASRAVGAANGRNPLPIIVPCHRVIGSDGSLTGFGGGLPAKVFLLRLEGHAVADTIVQFDRSGTRGGVQRGLFADAG